MSSLSGSLIALPTRGVRGKTSHHPVCPLEDVESVLEFAHCQLIAHGKKDAVLAKVCRVLHASLCRRLVPQQAGTSPQLPHSTWLWVQQCPPHPLTSQAIHANAGCSCTGSTRPKRQTASHTRGWRALARRLWRTSLGTALSAMPTSRSRQRHDPSWPSALRSCVTAGRHTNHKGHGWE
jgi:hypothetical protein